MRNLFFFKSFSSNNSISPVPSERNVHDSSGREQTRPKKKTLERNGNSDARRPPRVQYSAPPDGTKDNPKSHSKGSRLHSSSRDLVDNHESPRRLGKNVFERLYQTPSVNKSSLKDSNHRMPIKVEDIYHVKVNECFNPNLDVPCPKSCSLEKAYETVDSYHGDDLLTLQQRYKEAEERVLLLSEELEQESFVQDRKLKEDKLSLAVEVSGLLRSRIAEKQSSKEELRLVKSELWKEKSELQSVLEKELDRRSRDWSLKLNKSQLEEQRLRDQVRVLAEENVSLQRKVSSLTCSEQQVSHLTSRVEEVSKENTDLREKLSELEQKYLETEENLSCFKRNFSEKDEECKELQKYICRWVRTWSEQEKTIEGLHQAFSCELEKEDKNVTKFQMEQMRLTGVELSLRRKVESQKIEVDSLRHENIGLLKRLKGCGEEIGALTFKLDTEMWSRVCCLQNQGLPMLKESAHLCSQLLELLKRNGLDGQFVVEADVKVQGFNRGFENVTRSLKTVSSVLQKKSNSFASKSELRTSEETLRCELKAEAMLTSLLREKLYSQEMEAEQLRAELASAMRGNDIRGSEVQSVMDNLSHASHKLKDYELEMQKKDQKMNQLQNELHESIKELTYTRDILPKVSGERDAMFEKVNELKEVNVLLNSEIETLKEKIQGLDEDILIKEGEITILKDSLGNKQQIF
ncbi:uncharacterized protein [Euphorbia lathyris]|uniref:uncharacterized protein n=1 Tax=Euphorbia lathyris TaxID=212925 RepID=UPI0033143BEE